MDHLAILQNPWYNFVKNGTKPIESRASLKRYAPYPRTPKTFRLFANDTIYFKKPGAPTISLKAMADRVEYYEGHWAFEMLSEYRRQICIDEVYLESKREVQYLTLIWLSHVEQIPPVPFRKHDQRAWICDFDFYHAAHAEA